VYIRKQTSLPLNRVSAPPNRYTARSSAQAYQRV